MGKPQLTQDFVNSRFIYDGSRLYHKPKPASNKAWNTRYAYKECRTLNKGYFQVGISINGGYYIYAVHRIIFLMVHGYLPDYIDHIDGNRTNNKVDNLRAATKHENLKNRRLDRRNKSGAHGVSRIEQSGKWRAKITHNGQIIHIGCYKTKEEAVEARKDKEKEFGFHKNHGDSKARYL